MRFCVRSTSGSQGHACSSKQVPCGALCARNKWTMTLWRLSLLCRRVPVQMQSMLHSPQNASLQQNGLQSFDTLSIPTHMNVLKRKLQ